MARCPAHAGRLLGVAGGAPVRSLRRSWGAGSELQGVGRWDVHELAELSFAGHVRGHSWVRELGGVDCAVLAESGCACWVSLGQRYQLPKGKR